MMTIEKMISTSMTSILTAGLYCPTKVKFLSQDLEQKAFIMITSFTFLEVIRKKVEISIRTCFIMICPNKNGLI